jgi:hypothetical protein
MNVSIFRQMRPSRLVEPGEYSFMSALSLDVRTEVAPAMIWIADALTVRRGVPGQAGFGLERRGRGSCFLEYNFAWQPATWLSGTVRTMSVGRS